MMKICILLLVANIESLKISKTSYILEYEYDDMEEEIKISNDK